MNPSYLRWLRWALLGICGLVLTGGFAIACSFVYLAPWLPTAQNMHSVELAVPLRVYTRSGSLISQIGEQRRIPVRYEDIPDLVRQAVLAAEDDRFFEHSGLDWMGVIRAVGANVASAGSAQGGSTITQQAARNMFLTLDKTARRKLGEVFVTYRMERDFTKEQILAIYLNVVLFGQRSYGIAAAAETYYGKHLDELTVGQAATLAGVLPAPSRYNPVTNPKAAAMRRGYVLGRMVKLGYIDEATAAAAAKEPVASRGFAPLYDVEAAYVAEMARQEIVKRFGEAAVNAGYKVYTTLDSRLQTAANRALRLGLMEYDRRHGYRGHLGKVQLPAAASGNDLDGLLTKYESVGLLQPAVVTRVSDTTAEIHVRNGGDAKITWEGLSWARPVNKSGGLGASPRKAADVVAAGDVILVVTDKRGAAQLGQLPRAQSALVALDPNDGAIVSLVGGFDFHQNSFNRVVQARRQPGSGFKPFFYSAALEEGFTPASVFLDLPPMLNGSNDEENWRPKNSDGSFGGPTRLREGLVWSRNLVSIRILQAIGVDAAITHAVKFGFREKSLPRSLSLALGAQVATPLEMVTGFATFANGGFKIEPYFISRIEDSSGKVVFEAKPVIACEECEQAASAPLLQAEPVAAVAPGEPGPGPDATDDLASAPPALARQQIHDMDAPPVLRELARTQGGAGYLPADRLAPRVISPQNAWLMTDIMHDATTRGTARRTRALGRDDLSGKTGTNEDRDLWFNGFNHQLVASVWVGFDDEQSVGRGEEGASTAVPIWMHFMREALRNVPSSMMPRPGGLIDLKISPFTGALADPLDPDAIYEHFMLNHQPGNSNPGDAAGLDFGPAGPQGKSSGEPLF
ncbi:MAG: transglycosylase domain-containing protein [Steroidobacteraceae bacterium]